MGAEIIVKRNHIPLKEAQDTDPDKIVLSPGPGRPENSRVTIDILKILSKNIPTLGVCLGHQAIAYVYGGKIVQADRLIHGKTSMIKHNGRDLFKGVKNPLSATRYHSLIIDNKNVLESLEIIAKTETSEIMGIKHRKYPIFGVQFHPESILTQDGKKMLKNFLELVK